MGLRVPEGLAFDSNGLLPVVVQEYASGDLLMVANANAEALRRTAESGLAHFWSRTRRAIWKKGETSKNVLRVRELRADCDRDVLLMIAEPAGPACHTGNRTCFGDATVTAAGVLEGICRVIAERAKTMPEGSYTARLLSKGLDHSLKKLGEESIEVVLAAKGESDERLAEEAADLLYHLLVVLWQRRVAPQEVFEVLARRRVGT